MIEPTAGEENELENTTRAHRFLILHNYWKKVDVLIQRLLLREKPARNAKASAKTVFIRQDSDKRTGSLGMPSRWCQTWAQANIQIQPGRFRVIYDPTMINLASGDSLRGPGDHKALWEANMLYIASLFYVEIMFQQMQRLIMALPMMHQTWIVFLQFFFYTRVVK